MAGPPPIRPRPPAAATRAALAAIHADDTIKPAAIVAALRGMIEGASQIRASVDVHVTALSLLEDEQDRNDGADSIKGTLEGLDTRMRQAKKYLDLAITSARQLDRNFPAIAGSLGVSVDELTDG